MLIWGRNNNHLFRHNHKKTYSVPQKMPINKQIVKCATGYDFILILAKQPLKLYCYYQNALYQLSRIGRVVDFQTNDNMIVFIYEDGKAAITQFSSEKIKNDQLNLSTIHIKQKLHRVFMNYGDIFLQGTSNIYHLKRNEWYQTKTYSQPCQVEGLQKIKINYIAPALNYNYFLSQEGKVYASTKKDPHIVFFSGIKETFNQIAAADYFLGIAKNGRLYILGTYEDINYDTLAQFGKISQKFKKIYLSSENGFAITQKGQGWVWGKNANGQLGLSDYQPRTNPFPLITMQNQNIKQFYLGQGYTICLNTSYTSKRQIQNKPIKITFQNEEPQIKENIQFSLQIPKKPTKSTNLKIQNISSLNINQTKNELVLKSSKQNQNKCHRIPNIESNNASATKAKNNIKSPLKMHSRSRQQGKSRSISSSVVDKYNKSPYLTHFRQRSLTNIYNKRPIKQVRQFKQSNKSLKKLKQNVQQEQENECFNINTRLLQQNKCLLQENNKFKQIIDIKDTVIQEITAKIRLLQSAIEQHEINLTNRDHIMQEYQQRQKQYLIQIDELHKSIQLIVKAKSQVQYSQNKFTSCYESMKSQFQKEKEYYMSKIKELESLLFKQRTFYKQIIKQRDDQINFLKDQGQYANKSKSSQNKLEKRQSLMLNQSRNSGAKVLEDRSNKQNMQKLAKSKKQDEDEMKMDLIISRIEDSKVKIQKSVNKLNCIFE